MSDDGLNATPQASRLAIGLFGRRNAGKSSLMNALTGQDVSVVSDIAGTTTDPVYKNMELLPLGPVTFIDTGGLDDAGELGAHRMQRSQEAVHRCDIALVVFDANIGFGAFEREFLSQLRQQHIPTILVANKSDLAAPSGIDLQASGDGRKIAMVSTSALTGQGIDTLRHTITEHVETDDEIGLVEGLVAAGQCAVLVVPIDKAAPKGRLILPQQQTIRDILEHDGSALVVKEHELAHTLNGLAKPPAIVITDSQAFLKVSADTPPNVPLTSFSILFARQKGDLAAMVRGVRSIERLEQGAKVLIVEGCSHHRQSDDIGTVKIPRWIRQIVGGDVQFEWTSGRDFPDDLCGYALIVHCGGCMLNRREMHWRMQQAAAQGVPITNYGVLIASVMGILKRALEPFCAASIELEDK